MSRFRSVLTFGAVVAVVLAAAGLLVGLATPATAAPAPPAVAPLAAPAAVIHPVLAAALPGLGTMPALPDTPATAMLVGILASLALTGLERILPILRDLLDGIAAFVDVHIRDGLGDKVRQLALFGVGVGLTKLGAVFGWVITPATSAAALATYIATAAAGIAWYHVWPWKKSVATGYSAS